MSKKILVIILGAFIIFPFIATAKKNLEVEWPPTPGMKTILTPDSGITTFVKYFYEWGIVLGGLAVFIALVIAGFLYLTSIGDPIRMKEAKDRIFSAVGGLVLLLASWLILNTLNPQLTKLEVPDYGREFNESIEEEIEDKIKEIEEIEIVTNLPCDCVYFYPEKSYQGEPVVKGEKEKEGNFDSSWQSVRFMRKLHETEKKYIEEEIEEKIEKESLPPEEKKKLFEEILKERYSFYKKVNEDYYVEGGACKLTFYTTTGSWWQPWKWGNKEEIHSLYQSTPDLPSAVGGEFKFNQINKYQLEKVKIL